MEAILQNAEFWILLALLALIGILVLAKAPHAAAKALDGHGARIQTELDEARRLREEAQGLLDSLIQEHAKVEAMAAELLANAEAEAKRLGVEAKAKLEEQIKRRAELAERRIANAEAQAAAQVKAAAADLAAQVAETVLAARLAKAKSDPLIDQALARLPGKLN